MDDPLAFEKATGRKLDELRIAAKRVACLDLMARIHGACLGQNEDGWAFNSGRVFGEYLKELDLEERKLKT